MEQRTVIAFQISLLQDQNMHTIQVFNFVRKKNDGIERSTFNQYIHTCISGRMPVLNAKAMVAKAPKALKALAVLLPTTE